jgi:TRAP-type C4-dicarboxylate transport system substrate-binding protein
MKKRKILILVMVIALVIGSLAACTPADPPPAPPPAPPANGDNGDENGNGERGEPSWSFQMAGQNPVDFSDSILMRWAAEEIFERTDGDVFIEHFPAGMLGDYVQVLEEVMMGTIDMATITLPLHINYRFGIKYIPWLIEDYDEAKTLWTEGSNWFRLFNETAEDVGIRVLGVLPGGLMGIGTIEPFNHDNVWDFTQPSTELLIRLPPFETLHIMARVMQLRIQEIPFADLYPALSTGVVDGWIGGGVELNYHVAADVINYFYDFRYYDDSFSIIMNADTYYALPAGHRQVISEVMAEASARALDERAERDEFYMQRLRDLGITVFVPTDAERAQMADQFRRYGWPEFVDMFGLEVMNLLMEDVGLPPIEL